MECFALKAFAVFCILFIVISIVFLIIIYYYLYNKFIGKVNAIKFAAENSLFCGNPYCRKPPIDLPVPVVDNLSYDRQMARYCADIVLRIEQSYENKLPLVIPQGLEVNGILYSDDNAKQVITFGYIFMDENHTCYIAFRGTQTRDELFRDLDFTERSFVFPNTLLNSKILNQTTFTLFPKEKFPKEKFPKNFSEETPDEILVHSGFLDIFERFKPSLDEFFLKDLFQIKKVVCTGHSIGAAEAVLSAIYLKKFNIPIIGYVFALPRMGNPAFCKKMDEDPIIFKHVNTCDEIPAMPASVCPNFSSPEFPFFFSDFGLANTFYFTKNRKSLMLNHLLDTYIEYFN